MSSIEDHLKQPFIRTKKKSVFAHQRDQYNQWRYCEFLSSGFSGLGIAVQTLDYEARYGLERTHNNCAQRDIGEYYRWLCVLFTVVAVCFQVFRHHTKHMWEKFKATNRLSSNANYRAKPSLFTFGFFLDTGVLCLFPYPYAKGTFFQPERCSIDSVWTDTTICYNVSEILYVLMFFRIYLILRCVLINYSLMDRHTRFTAAGYGVKANTRFTIRSLLRVRPYMMLCLFWIPISLILAVMMRVFERPYMDCSNLDFEPYYNALWLAMMTITTVNYADFYPSTHFGRIVAQIAGIWGLFLISMMVIVMSRSFALTWVQQKALFKTNSSRHAAKVIIAAFLAHVARRTHGKFSAHYIQKHAEMLSQIQNFKQNKQMLEMLYDETCTEVTDIKPMLVSMHARVDRTEKKLDELISLVRQQLAK